MDAVAAINDTGILQTKEGEAQLSDIAGAVISSSNNSNNNDNPWPLFLYALRSPITKIKYQQRLRLFLDTLEMDEQEKGGGDSNNAPTTMTKTTSLEEMAWKFARRGKQDPDWAFRCVLKFMQSLKEKVERKERSVGTARNYLKSIKLFCEMADIQIPWKKINRGLPRGRKYAEDRVPTLDEIRRLVQYPDRRIKPIVYVMSSCGARLGMWDYLCWSHIQPMQRDGKIVAARIAIYGGEEESYFSFMSSEAYYELASWMRYREDSGETITGDGWVMRNLWDIEQGIRAGSTDDGFVYRPRKMTSVAVKRLLERALQAQGIRKAKLEQGKKRHPFAASHSLRKWFKTRCELAGMKPINVEDLMGHSTGISDHYYRPSEIELLEDYLKAVDALTISNENRLKAQIEELEEKAQGTEYIASARADERERHIESLTELNLDNSDGLTAVADMLVTLTERIKELEKRANL